MTTWGLAARGSTISALLVALTACSGGQVNHADTHASQVVTRPADSGAPFSLYTHCGIDELRLGDKFYERVGGPLDDGSGNPPSGWDNPYQTGRLSRRGDLVIFTDPKGHQEEFTLRPGATDFKHICS